MVQRHPKICRLKPKTRLSVLSNEMAQMRLKQCSPRLHSVRIKAEESRGAGSHKMWWHCTIGLRVGGDQIPVHYTSILISLCLGRSNKMLQTSPEKGRGWQVWAEKSKWTIAGEEGGEGRREMGNSEPVQVVWVDAVLHTSTSFSCHLATKLGHIESPWWHNRLHPLSKQLFNNALPVTMNTVSWGVGFGM